MRRRLITLLALLLLLPAPAPAAEKGALALAGPAGLEDVLAGQLYLAALRAQGLLVRDMTGLANPALVRAGLENGQVDLGLLRLGESLTGLLGQARPPADPRTALAALQAGAAKQGLAFLAPLAVNPGMAVLVRRDEAASAKWAAVSDLAAWDRARPGRLSLGLSQAFHVDPHGYARLAQAYGLGLPLERLRRMDPGLIYQALRDRGVLAAVGQPGHGLVREYDLLPLQDDQGGLPAQHFVLALKPATAQAHPALAAAWSRLAEKLTLAEWTKLHLAVAVKLQPLAEAAGAWIKGQGF